jgi:hypothetical protein
MCSQMNLSIATAVTHTLFRLLQSERSAVGAVSLSVSYSTSDQGAWQAHAHEATANAVVRCTVLSSVAAHQLYYVQIVLKLKGQQAC